MFKSNMFRHLARSFSSKKSDISYYIASDSEEGFNRALSAYNLAKKNFEKNDIAQAKVQIKDALFYLSDVEGESPALASFSRMFKQLKRSIEENDNSCSNVKNGSKITAP